MWGGGGAESKRGRGWKRQDCQPPSPGGGSHVCPRQEKPCQNNLDIQSQWPPSSSPDRALPAASVPPAGSGIYLGSSYFKAHRTGSPLPSAAGSLRKLPWHSEADPPRPSRHLPTGSLESLPVTQGFVSGMLFSREKDQQPRAVFTKVERHRVGYVSTR